MPELIISNFLPHVIGAMSALGFTPAAIVASAVAIPTGMARRSANG